MKYVVEITSSEAYARMLSGGGGACPTRRFDVEAENKTKAKEKAKQGRLLGEEILRIVDKEIFDIEKQESEERRKRWHEECRKEYEEDLQTRAKRKQELDMTVKELLQKIQTEIDLGHINENTKVYLGGYKITDVWNFDLNVDDDGDLKIY